MPTRRYQSAIRDKPKKKPASPLRGRFLQECQQTRCEGEMIMKVRNLFLRVLSVIVFAAILMSTVAVLDKSSVKAFRPVSDPCPSCLNFGMIGITHEQTARLNIVNWGDGPIPAGDRSTPVPSGDRPIRAELSLLAR